VALASWYFLNERIPHARLAIPRRMADQEWNLEHLARLRVEVSDKPFLVGDEHVERLIGSASGRRELPRRRKSQPRRYLYLHYQPDANDYVLAETDEPNGPVFVMPRSDYARVAAR
jgi:hypothetical protein